LLFQHLPTRHGSERCLRKEHAAVHVLDVGSLSLYSSVFILNCGFSAFNALFLAYAGIQITEIHNIESELGSPASAYSTFNIPISTLTRIIPIVIGLSEAAFITLGWKIYNEFGWKVYKYIGADRRLKKMYTSYQVFQCLVKFDVFFFVGFCVQFIGLVLEKGDWEYYVTWAALPLSVLLLIEGHLAARHENKWMMATFMSGCVGAMIYFVYKVAVVHNC
jgi:hypothetical protein